MNLQEKFSHYIEIAHTAFLESQTWEKMCEPECAADERRVMDIYKAKAVLIMLNSPRIEAIVAANPIIRITKP